MLVISEKELRALMKETVQETLTSFGIDTKDPFELQRDFSHLREWRKSSEAIKTKGMLTIITLFITGLAGILWLGLTSEFKGG